MTTIILDKVDASPPHALNRQEIKAIISVIPEDWKIKLSVVHLKATLPENSQFERPVIYSDLNYRLNVCCRGLKPNVARREILRELAINGLNIQTRLVHRLSKIELKKVDDIVTPLLQKAEAIQSQF